MADSKETLKELESAIRTRIGSGFWKKWKNCKTKVRNMRKLGFGKHESYKWGNTNRVY